VAMAHHRGGRDPRQVYELVPFHDSGSHDSGSHDSGSHGSGFHDVGNPTAPWPGSVPLPAPALTLQDPEQISVLDADGRVVSVDGRGLASAAPTVLVRGVRSHRIGAWAGPWPVDERWWEARARRSARFQLVIESSDGPRACLVEVTAGVWWLTADYM
jgi:protein ImuB